MFFPDLIIEHYLFISILFIIAILMPSIIRTSRKNMTSREMVMLAVLAAIASVSRIPFASIPSVQPTTFVIIASAIALGPQSGLIIGASAALISNMLLGQGPWTPWQMVSWGMIGFVAGLFAKSFFMKRLTWRLIYGFIVGFLFGWVMNLWILFSGFGELNLETFILLNTSSFYFDLAHALSNVFFLFLFSGVWIKILNRFKEKYGVFGDGG
ncbi:ECF transporter S component [Oceanobacillus saliphilus]|uniref:ECF transporter S component n=1 Tax=Oceanobacillus saliphilus TaxID=2925834 RepID=UPI00201DDC37|nr:ECF transporter S component [Oceanobacillus saliphilus]